MKGGLAELLNFKQKNKDMDEFIKVLSGKNFPTVWRPRADADVYHDVNAAHLLLHKRGWHLSRCGRYDHADFPRV